MSITQLDAQIKTLQAHTLGLIQANGDMNRHYERLLSIKGVGDKSAIQRLGERLMLPEELRAKQWVGMAGLDRRHHQSGTSVEKPARISKAGNRALRTALFMPAMCAVRPVPQVKAYAEHLGPVVKRCQPIGCNIGIGRRRRTKRYFSRIAWRSRANP